MAVLPIVRLFFPCAHIEWNENNNTITLVDPIDSIHLPKDVEKNFALGPLFFYGQVKEGLGTFYFRIEVRGERGRRFARSKPKEIVFTERNHNAAEELVFMFRDLRIERPGILRFDLLANEVVLGSWELRIIGPGD